MIPMLPSPLDIGPQVWGKQLRHFFGVYDMVDESYPKAQDLCLLRQSGVLGSLLRPSLGQIRVLEMGLLSTCSRESSQ